MSDSLEESKSSKRKTQSATKQTLKRKPAAKRTTTKQSDQNCQSQPTPSAKSNLPPLADAREQSDSSLKAEDNLIDREAAKTKDKKSNGSRSCTSADDLQPKNKLSSILAPNTMRVEDDNEQNSMLNYF